MEPPADAHITVRNLTMAYGDFIIQRDLNFTINRGDIFIIMGGSGCGKSTLMRHLVGLKAPRAGQVLYGGESYWDSDPAQQHHLKRRFGVMYQSGALWSSMTLAENIALLLEQYTDLGPEQIRRVATLKLALVGLRGFEDFYPAEISGGMQKRAGIARAMALRESLGTTMVIVTHGLASIFAIGSNSVFLDPETKTMITTGNPHTLLKECGNPKVRAFLTRGAA